MTTATAAQTLGISHDAVRMAIFRKTLKAKRKRRGRKYVWEIDPGSVEAYQGRQRKGV